MNRFVWFKFLILLPGIAALPWACNRQFDTPASPMGLPPGATNTLTTTASPTTTPTNTSTFMNFKTYTPTLSPTMTATPTNTNTGTDTSTPTIIKTPTHTGTSTNTLTSTNTPTITSTPTFIGTAMASSTSFDMSSGVTTLTGLYYFNCVHIGGSAVVSISGGATIFTQCFSLDAGATITGVGREDFNIPGGWGSGKWITCEFGPLGMIFGGGGHGGAGGGVSFVSCASLTVFAINGCSANDDPVYPSFVGSPGGYSAGVYGSYNSEGGALLRVVVYDPVTNTLTGPANINGTIDMSGHQGDQWSGEESAGGAGGTIFFEANSIIGTGSLISNGGSGSAMGGGGGGGIISLIQNSTSFPGISSVVGGGGMNPGSDGSNGIVSFTTPPNNGY